MEFIHDLFSYNIISESYSTQGRKCGQDKNPYFKISHAPTVAEGEAYFVSVKHNFSESYSIPELTATYKKTNKYESGIFKHTRSGKLDVEETPHIGGRAKPNIQDKYNPFPKTLPV